MTTYQEYEASVAGGKPIELYDIYDTQGNHWRYNTSSGEVVYGDYSYNAAVIKRSAPEIGGTIERSSLTLELDYQNEFAMEYARYAADLIAYVDIYRQHEGQTAKFWQGVLIGVSFDGKEIPSAVFQPLTASQGRLGMRRRCQKLCDHVLYDAGCQLNAESYKASGVVDYVTSDGLQIQSTTFALKANEYYVAGMIKIGYGYRFVLWHEADTVHIDRPFHLIEVGSAFDVYAGCDLTPTTCLTKFNNKLNFGGLEFLTTEDPFTAGTDGVQQTTPVAPTAQPGHLVLGT